jgi:hypothetical protein
VLAQKGRLFFLSVTRMLRHLKPAAVPPPMAPVRARPAIGDWVA